MNFLTRFGIFVVSLIALDRISKALVLHYCAPHCTFNRGISWGMLNYENSTVFIILTAVVILITAALAIYAFRRWQAGFAIWGEILILAGSLSNIIDRMLYGGVVDFIELRVGSWVGPAFNIADSMVVIGVALMAYELVFNTKR